MEKVRFEAFNVGELRVLRRACYEAVAAFGDPGHTAAERATLDDLAVEILGQLKKKEAAAARQKQEEPLEKTVAKAVEDSMKDVVDKLPFAQKRLFLRATAGSAAGKRSSKICARSRFGASAAAPTATTRISRTPHLICLA